MPTATQSDDNSVTLSTDALKWDEFLPIVAFDRGINSFEIDGEKLTLAKDKNNKEENIEFSEYLDIQYRNSQVLLFETEKQKIKIPFTVKKGSSESHDDDGLLSIKLSVEDKDIKLITKKEFKTKYDSTLNVEIEFTGNAKKEFYIDFYARDNEDDTWSTGELVNIHCGRFKVTKKETCICKDNDWPTLPPMVLEMNKVAYGTELSWTSGRECYHYALQQLKDLGYWVKTERWNKKWDGTVEMGPHIYQLYVSADVAGMKSGLQEKQFKKAMVYLKEAMKRSEPVMVGLDYNSDYDNTDLTTDHFGVIVGCGKINDKLYFDVCDNAYENIRYYCDCKTFSLIPAANSRINSYDKNVQAKITQVRESKKL
ncbi:hypothetical protein [Algibacter lectus]|uniref:hypothetical protein n=1 Tax=Algibacter lectus TaxID=221126 RepID=UPI00249505EA|nr:hypothetical protein [Algibacter lectus]